VGRLLIEVARRSLRRTTQYRTAVIAGVIVNTVFGYLRAFVLIWIATNAGGELRGLTAQQLATFAFVSQGFIAATGAFGDREFAERIATGDVVIDFYRPVDIQLWWFAHWIGKVAWLAVARGVPPVLLGALTFDLYWPTTPWHWPFFAVSILLASLVGFGIRFLSNLTAFWLLDNRGVDQMVTVAVYFFAGLLLPINLFPAWLETVARALPFASMIQLPTELYLGLHSPGAAAVTVGQQLLWAVVLILAGRVVLAVATRRIVVQGG